MLLKSILLSIILSILYTICANVLIYEITELVKDIKHWLKVKSK